MDSPVLYNLYPKPLLKWTVISLYFIFLLSAGVFAYKRPHYNWDMLPYMALVLRQDVSGFDKVHQLTYRIARENLPSDDYNYFVQGEYRKNLNENPTAFYNTLPFYAVKPLYIQATYLFYKTGFSLPAATVMPSILFYILTGLLMLYWLTKYLNLFWSFAAGILIMAFGFMISLARLSSPDSMSTFFLLAAIFFIMERHSVIWMSVFLLLSLFTRLDNIIPCVVIPGFLFFTGRYQMKIKLNQFLALLAILTVSYFGIVVVTMKPFGWGLFYYPTFMRNLDQFHTSQAVFSLNEYLIVAITGAKRAIEFYNFIPFLFIFLLIIYTPGIRFKVLDDDKSLAALLMLIILFRFILYPDLSDRFNAAYYLTFMLILVKKIVNLSGRVQPV